MKGIILNIAEKFITVNYGEETFEEIIETCELETKDPFVGPGTYPDSDLIVIITKSCVKLSISVEEFLIRLGTFAFPYLAKKMPHFVEKYDHPKDFLKTIEATVHVEVKKIIKDSKPPSFQYFEPNKNELIITYYSERKLYPFMEGLIIGVAKYFNSPIQQSHKIYIENKLEYADFHLKFDK